MSFPLSASIAGSLSTSIAVHAPASGSTLLLDTGVASASNGWSLRKLRAAYAGNCIKVRRSSDNTTQDIGFSGNDLDTTALLAFCGAGNGFVHTRYDQVGSANLTQTTNAAQPQIVSAGALITKNGKPCESYDGTNHFMLTTGTTLGGASQFSASLVGALATGASNYTRLMSYLGNGDGADFLTTTSVALFQKEASQAIAMNRYDGTSTISISKSVTYDQLFSALVTFDATTAAIYADNTAGTTNAYTAAALGGTDAFGLGSVPSGAFNQGAAMSASEVVLWRSALSSGDRGTVYTNQKAYWGTP